MDGEYAHASMHKCKITPTIGGATWAVAIDCVMRFERGLCSLLVQAVMGAASSVMHAILAALRSDAEAGSHSNGSAEALVW